VPSYGGLLEGNSHSSSVFGGATVPPGRRTQFSAPKAEDMTALATRATPKNNP
jgi:hypothetical protein